MFSVAAKRIAISAAKQDARAISMVGLRAVAAQQCAPITTMTHSCGPSCSTHKCCGRVACMCRANKTTTRGFFSKFFSSAPDTSTPAGALAALEAGNARFVSGETTAPNQSKERLEELQGGQAPFAAFLSCADSRVPVEMVFDQGFGDVFVCRIAGNIVNTETIGSLEFGTAVLGSKVLYVLGHSSCGAVNATIAGAAVPGVISSLYYQIKPACDLANGDLDKAIEENVKLQVSQLAVSPVLKGLVDEGKLEIVGGVYDLTTGKVNRVC